MDEPKSPPVDVDAVLLLPNENPPVAGAAGLPNNPPVDVEAGLLDAPNSPPLNPVCAGCCVCWPGCCCCCVFALAPNSPPPPSVGAAVVVAGLAPKLKPPVAACAAAVPAVEVAVLVFVAPPPKEKPPDVPEKGLLAGGCEKENEADRPSVEPVAGAEGVEPNILQKALSVLPRALPVLLRGLLCV